MKIAYFVHCFPPAKGGLEFLSGEIVKILRDAGHEVHVFTGKGQTLDSYKTFSNWVDESEDDEYIHRLPLNFFWQRLTNKFLYHFVVKFGVLSPWYFGPLLKFGEREEQIIKKCDLIFGAGMPTSSLLYVNKYAKKFSKPLYVLTAYHPVNYYNNSFVFQKCLSGAKQVIVLSNYEKLNLLRKYKVNKQKLKLLNYSPIKKQVAQKISFYNQKRIKRLKSKTLTIGFIGQISVRKNLESIGNISKILTDIPHKILLAGQRTNSSSVIEKAFSTFNNIEIIYNFSDQEKTKLYSEIDVFINPTSEESYGIATLEALAHGCLVMTKISPFDYQDVPMVFRSDEEAAKIINGLTKEKLSIQLDRQIKIGQKYTFDYFKKQLLSIF